ncbi:lipopolysaccharide 3-alpha-galactosyltransferase [Kluyvera genomosp. 1]|uniref:lipopolysaccharide 3-alpha-galactosyltransferase n=1 Tax=Kluyvera genomosp. 1 TaxID=2774053 RepID=UPI000689C570|nr:lipopolysaccharide 3-alpha-galactosyltransferase [Kluyvera genomosp. 1]
MTYPYLKADEMIKETIVFNEGQTLSADTPFHIAYGIDKNFLFGCGVSIASVLLHNRSMNFVFHVFIDVISDDEKRQFAQLAQDNDTCIQIHIVNCERLAAFPTTKNWSVAMYFRFIIGDYFIGQQTRLLYLDADIVCQGDIHELMTLELADTVVGVVPERDEKWWLSRSKSLDCPAIANGYFNSGVLLLNIPAWASEYVSGKAMSLLSDKSITRKLSFMDQDILNIILSGKVTFIDGKYNTQFSLNYELKETFINPIHAGTVLIHYVGPTKPWHNWACYPSAEPFLKAKASSPWKNLPLLKPVNSNYARYCAKHNFKKHYYFKWFVNNIYYYYLKLVG